TTSSINNLTAGNYCVTVTDSRGCTASCCYAVTQPAALSVTCTGTNPTTGNNNGSVATSVSGGTQPYSYHWSNGSTAANLSGLSASTYCVTVTDANNCTASCCSTLSSGGGCGGNGNAGIYPTATDCN